LILMLTFLGTIGARMVDAVAKPNKTLFIVFIIVYVVLAHVTIFTGNS
jgi:hypothetical protein